MKSAATACAVMVALATVSTATASDVVFNQNFESNTDGWFDSSNGWHGTVTRVASGTAGINSASGSHHAIFTDQGGASTTGGFTRFDGFRSSWPGSYTASVDVYLDTSWSAGSGFDYSVASSRTNGDHLRDFIFHVAMDMNGALRVGGSNNSNFATQMNLANNNNFEVTESGWYTMQHVFRDAGDGSLAVDLVLRDAMGDILFVETRNNPADLIGTLAGGNRYGWFTHVSIGGGLHVDNVTLTIVPLPPAVFAGLGMVGAIAGVRAIRRR
ncbi:MAG: hypothetical protein LAT64_13160 [Phycisphaerales bacterium]|nr:hypothetical protein [Planctomycetota bacterium]MCH8509703.1 hypothetical protein [Phycisphaerales bacterium]